MGLARNTTLAASIMLASSAFADEIEIQWVNPVENVDGTPVSELQEFTLHQRSPTGAYIPIQSISYANGPVTSALFDLPCGDYFLTATVTDIEGDQSGYSNVVERQIACPPPPDSIPRPPILLSGQDTGLLFISPVTTFTGDIAEIQLYNDPAFQAASGRFVTEFTPASVSGTLTMFSRDEGGFGTGGHLTFSIIDGTISMRHQNTTESRVLAGGTVLAGQPYTAEYIFGPSGATLILDGIIVAQDTTWTVGINDNNLPMGIGAAQVSVDAQNPTRYTNPFNGELSVRFYNE